MHPPDVIDTPPANRRRHPFAWIVIALLVLFFAGGTLLSFYVDALWFNSLGYGRVFWRTLTLQSTVFSAFGVSTFAVLFGGFLALEPSELSDGGGFIMVNGRPVRIPVGPVLRFLAGVFAAVIALATAAGMAADWPTFALWWYGRPTASAFVSAADRSVDPIFGRPITFYLFSLPAWDEIAGWLMTLAIVLIVIALLAAALSGTARAAARISRRRTSSEAPRGVAFAWAFGMIALALRVWLNRFDLLFEEHTIFSGVSYTDAHVTIVGMTLIAGLLLAGGLAAAIGAAAGRTFRWLVLASAPAVIAYAGVGLTASYVSSFIVKPNELVKERPFIEHNIALTRQAYGLNRLVQTAFPAETSVAAADPSSNQATILNVRLWDWRVLQDTLRQLQEIRTYYDFPDIDIDRYPIDGSPRQVMLAARELNVEKLPVSSRNWINERLIYTHGYGVTMNYVNGLTPEGLPDLLLKDMPVQSVVPSITVTRPEIYFGETTNTDVYVRTRQQEFNYPQGQTNSLTSYAADSGIVIGTGLRKLLIALERGDIAKLPFSDDVTPDSRLLMRRNVSARVQALAPFLQFDEDPYIVVRADGRLAWMLDGYVMSDRYPYSRSYRVDGQRVNYLRNSVKAVIDAYDGSTNFYVFDTTDPIIAAYRGVFPALFRDAWEMPADLRSHVRYPELLLSVQADVYGLYHMTDPEVFYNREDLWTVATDVATAQQQSSSASAAMEPNFVVMKLPGQSKAEFVEMLPFSPANRNNLIGWIAGRSDGDHYGEGIVFDFPKTRLVDGPLQVEARIDQNPQLSGQLSLWNQHGSHVRRGSLLVIPIGRALLYVESIYLQAERSPMPELRLIVLAMQDRLVYAPTFDAALTALFGQGASSGVSVPATAAGAVATPPGEAPQPSAPAADRELIAKAAAALADYQRLTAEGRLAEAGQKLEEVKRVLDELKRRIPNP